MLALHSTHLFWVNVTDWQSMPIATAMALVRKHSVFSGCHVSHKRQSATEASDSQTFCGAGTNVWREFGMLHSCKFQSAIFTNPRIHRIFVAPEQNA